MSPRALQNSDIIHEIIKQYADLELGCTTGGQRRQVASLCRVCKTFYDPAVAVLWTRLPSLRPLLSLLPEFDGAYRAYVESKSTEPFECVSSTPLTFGGNGSLTRRGDAQNLLESVNSEAWTRFREHAALVRHLIYDHSRPMRQIVSIDGWSHLGRLLAGTPLLPSLRELVWGPIRTCEDLGLLASLSLSYLSLHGTWSTEQGSDDVIVVALQDVLTKTPALTSLRLTDFGSDLLALLPPDQLSRLEDVHIGVHDLERLARKPWQSPDYGFPNADSLRVLSTLPALKNLQIDFKSQRPGLDFEGFRTLRKLRVTDYGGDVLALLATLSSPDLCELTVVFSSATFNPTFTWVDVYPLCWTIAQRSPRLESITLLFMSLRNVARSPEATLDALRPLLDLRCLKMLRFWSMKEAVEFSDSVLGAFAEAWPALVSLSLCCHTDRMMSLVDPPGEPEPDSQAVTLRALEKFAKHCKSLETLRLPHLYVSPTDVVDPSAPLGLRLHALGICKANVADVGACALAIGFLFPHIQTQASMDQTLCVNSFAASLSGWRDVLLAVESMRGEEAMAGAGKPSVA